MHKPNLDFYMKEIILASSNPGKIAEFKAILAPIRCTSQTEYNITGAAETGLSFIENALLKARHVSELTGKPVLADDSGLVVAALKGEPGIYSARFAGVNANDKRNIEHLLKKLEGIESRRAYFYCALVLVRFATDPTPILACGKWEGEIAERSAGEQGFGYDPIFFVPQYQCSAAQLPREIKNQISHRAQALQHLLKELHHENAY